MSSKSIGKEWQAGGSLQRHELYYILSGDVVFLVGNTLFRVHRYFLLRESPLFRDMLSLPVPPGSSQKGTSDELPISLPQVTSQEFADFLWVFYNPKYSVYEASVDTWTGILRLAHLWQCDEIRDLAFRELSFLHIPPVELVLLTMRYDARTEWWEKALGDLGVRPEPLSIEEGQKLGVELSIRIAELREKIRDRRKRTDCTPWRVRQRSEYPPPPSRIPTPGGASRPTAVIEHVQPRPRYVLSQQDLEDVRDVFSARMIWLS